ncbi:MAG TPA: hypothetical protein VF616_32180, partial [Duganella sp.]
MGLFSLFKKTDQPRPDEAPDPLSDDAAARLAANSETARQHQQARQREIARATAMKIDAIESAMAFDIFNQPEPAWGSQRQRPPRHDDDGGPDTEALAGLPTTVLLGDDELPQAAVAAQTAPAVEEIAILYANGQDAAAEQLLTDSIAAGADQDRTVWWMLFDLYQIGGQRERFDNLSIDYVSTFETSPPAGNAPAADAPGWAGVAPSTTFSGVLDAGIGDRLEHLLRLADAHPVLRLEFHRVTELEAPACWLL